MTRLLLTRRWLVRHTLILGAVIVCVTAGIWQLSRRSERAERNARIVAQAALEPLSLSSAPPPGDALRRAVATGAYDPGREVVLRDRALRGAQGSHLLTPLVLADGSAVLVDRGWVPASRVRDPLAAAPAGRVRVAGLLLPSERPRPLTPGASAEVYRIDTAAIGSRLPYRLAPVYLLLASQEPAQAGAVPVVVPPPETSAGPHLSYAVQWFTFAAIALGGHLLLARRALRPSSGGVVAAPAEEGG